MIVTGRLANIVRVFGLVVVTSGCAHPPEGGDIMSYEQCAISAHCNSQGMLSFIKALITLASTPTADM